MSSDEAIALVNEGSANYHWRRLISFLLEAMLIIRGGGYKPCFLEAVYVVLLEENAVVLVEEHGTTSHWRQYPPNK